MRNEEKNLYDIDNYLQIVKELDDELNLNYSIVKLVENKLGRKNKLRLKIEYMINDNSKTYTALEVIKLKENSLVIEKEIALIKKKKESVEKIIKKINNNLDDIFKNFERNNIKLDREDLLNSLLNEKNKLCKLDINNDDNKRVCNTSNNVKGKYNIDKYKEIYIIDTNIFIEEPNILNYINNDVLIVISKTVVDELDFNKQRKEIAYNVREAIRSISNYKFDNMIFVQADMGILPYDYKRTGDNLILSVAMQFKEYNPIIVTNDIAFALKARGEGIKSIKLIDIVEETR